MLVIHPDSRREAEEDEFYDRLERLSPKAPITPLIIGANVLIYILLCMASGSLIRPDAMHATHWGANYGPLVFAGQWWRLLTCLFIHFGVLHILFNMLALYQVGTLVERMYGSIQFAVLYLIAGLCGSVASLWWNPGVNGGGASGAIFGVLGGLCAFVANRRNAVPRSVMTDHLYTVGLFVAYSLFGGILQHGIDNSAHIGGLIGGMLAGLILARPLEATSRASIGMPKIVIVVLAFTAASMAVLSYVGQGQQERPSWKVQRAASLTEIRQDGTPPIGARHASAA